MHINLCCRNAFMPQHLLNGPNVRAIFQQVRRKGVAKSMGAYIFSYAGFLRLPFHNRKNHGPGEPAAISIQKKGVFIAFSRILVCSHLFPVKVNVFLCDRADGDKALFTAFTQNF